MLNLRLIRFWITNFLSTDRVVHKWLKSGNATMNITLPDIGIDVDEITFNVQAHGFDLYFHNTRDRKKTTSHYTLPDGTKRLQIEIPYDGWGKKLN